MLLVLASLGIPFGTYLGSRFAPCLCLHRFAGGNGDKLRGTSMGRASTFLAIFVCLQQLRCRASRYM